MQVKRTIRRPEVLAKTGLSATTIYNLEKRGEFPKHFMLTPRCAVWDEAEVETFLESRKKNPVEGIKGPETQIRRVTFGVGGWRYK